jgi:hypothetical protein
MTIDTRVCVANRKHERCVPETAYVAYRIGLPFIGQKGESPVMDLSEGGLLIQVPERIKWGKGITMTLTIPRYNEEISLGGIVRRCFESRKDSQIYAGIEFCNVAPPVRAKLRAMCEYFKSPSYKDKCRERQQDNLLL